MLAELRPMSLSDAARHLGVDPFEVVRLLVAAGGEAGAGHGWPTSLHLSHEQAEALRASAGIEHWWQDAPPPADDNPLRSAVLGAVQQLVSRGLVGERTTRLDNLWRGLGYEQQVAIEQAVMVLLEEAKLVTAASPRGVQVSIAPGAEKELEQLASGEAEHAGLAAVWSSTAAPGAAWQE